jgi:hypothetical protein
MNEMSRTFHGLKAASTLLLLVEDDVATGRLKLQEIAIDLDDGTTVNFSAEEYIALAKRSVEFAIGTSVPRGFVGDILMPIRATCMAKTMFRSFTVPRIAIA